MRRVLLIGLIVASVVMMRCTGAKAKPARCTRCSRPCPARSARCASWAAPSSRPLPRSATRWTTSRPIKARFRACANTMKQLVQQYSQMEEYKQEAQRLQKLLDLKDTYQIEGTGARVIGRSSEAWSQTVIINKARTTAFPPVRRSWARRAVVGQIVSTSSHTATVRLLTDPQSGAAAWCSQAVRRASCAAAWWAFCIWKTLTPTRGERGRRRCHVGPGRQLCARLIIGTVVKVDAQQGDTSRRAVVSPNDAISTLEDVLVVSSVGSDADDSDDSSTSSSSSSTASSSSSSSNSSTSANSNSGSSSNNGTASSNNSNNSNGSNSSTNEGGR